MSCDCRSFSSPSSFETHRDFHAKSHDVLWWQVVFIATRDSIYEKVKSNIQEVRARKGCVIAITDEGNDELDELCEYVIHIPQVRTL